MNCEEFESLLNNQARAEWINADGREPYLAHAKTCGPCATRLADKRALTTGLRALAAESEGKDAPPRIETALLAAFRQQQSAPVKTNVVTFPVRHRQIQLLALAAAAVLLIASAVVASQLLKNTSSEQPRIALLPSPTVQPKRIPAPPQVNVAAEIADPDEKRPVKPRKKPAPRRAFADGSSVVASLGEFTPVLLQENGQEVTTDFMPLSHEFDSEPLESGQLIRVQMPRTALASFGLPVNLERANVPVKADVLLAEDGSARAIRFVR